MAMYKRYEMKHTIIDVIFLMSCTSINLVHCQQNETWLTTTQMSLTNDDQCPLWFFFTTATKQSECYMDTRTNAIVKRGTQEAQIRMGDCMTYEEGEGIYITCLLYTSPSPRDATLSRMPSSA